MNTQAQTISFEPAEAILAGGDLPAEEAERASIVIPAPGFLVFFAVQGAGGFTAQSAVVPGQVNDKPSTIFNTLKGDTQGMFRSDRVIRLIASPRKGHFFSHWLFSQGQSEVFGEGTSTTVLPRLGLTIKAVFEAPTSGGEDSEERSFTAETFVDADFLEPDPLAQEALVFDDDAEWVEVESSPSEGRLEGVTATCNLELDPLPKILCRGSELPVGQKYSVTIDNTSFKVVRGTLVGRLVLSSIKVPDDIRTKDVEIDPRSKKTFALVRKGKLTIRKTGSFTYGGITQFDGLPVTSVNRAVSFKVVEC